MQTTDEALTAVGTAEDDAGLRIRRFFTRDDVQPYDELEWELRDAVISDWKSGEVAFEQRGVEFPTSWSMNATTIVAQKYFRGHLGTPERERSVKHMIDRVADTITRWGLEGGYFADESSAEVFNHELKHLLVTQKAAFNSPVWFNCGTEDKPQCSACFILSVEDTMTSILNWYYEEGVIFKGGSGSGVNLSKIRSSKEKLRGGGEASGPVSFMRGADASAGTIKSGGKTRRAAKMVILDVDHPDVEEFIWCKRNEEQKAAALAAAGFDMGFDGADTGSIQYQNANNSVRVTDEFMQAAVENRDFELKTVTGREAVERVGARDLLNQIAQAAWECADPGVQYDTTINDWHTTPNAGRINGSNPCFPGSARVHTDKGLVRFEELTRRVQQGETFGVYTHDATNAEAPSTRVELTSPEAFMVTGRNPIVRLRFSNGQELRCTPNHSIWTTNRGYVAAEDLTPEDRVLALDVATPASQADQALPVRTDLAAYREKGDRAKELRLPEKWSDELAHYLGWHTGDGSVSGNCLSTIYGGEEEQTHHLPRHRELLAWLNGDQHPTPSMQENGTQQLRLTRRPLRKFFEALGVSDAHAADKRVPWAVFEAPEDAQAAFLRGLFDADGTVVDVKTKGDRYVSLGSSSPELLRDVQVLLTAHGISSRIYATRGAEEQSGLSYVRRDGTEAIYASKQAYQLRISGRSLEAYARGIGFDLPGKHARLVDVVEAYSRYDTDRTVRLEDRTHDGVELTYNLTEPRNHSYVVDGVAVRNCSEYMHLDNSACNLASLNLRKFEVDGTFDVDAFKRAVEIVFTAQEIIVGNSSYPTEKIEENAHRFRQLGLGYANLGGLLMSQGIPYDSEEGRAWAGAVTALMTGHAYRTSAELAAVQGPFEGFADDREGTLRVIGKHRDAAHDIDADKVPADLLAAAQQAWNEAHELGHEHGIRNAQSSVLAPTGTIGLMMDCDTTGVEPDLGLVKMKKLVGGGTMRIVNQTVPRALDSLGYQPEQIEAIVDYIDEHSTIEGAPGFREEHLPVFDCAMGERSISPMGHVRMMGAVQPFISGAISKCVVGETLVPTEDGLVRIEELHEGESADSFRDDVRRVASLGGEAKTDAFYYGGTRKVQRVVLRSGHEVTGTENHRVLVGGPSGLAWRYLDEIEVGEYVGTRYGSELWSEVPARLDGFVPSPSYGPQKAVSLPNEMSEELAFLLGAYCAEGSISRSNWTIRITNQNLEVLERVKSAFESLFDVDASIVDPVDRCAHVAVASKTLVELFEFLGCGVGASGKRIPSVVLRSPRSMVLSFLQGLWLDAYAAPGAMPKWALCVDSPELLDDVQAVLTNLGVVHSRIAKHNEEHEKTYDEVYATGHHAARLLELVPFLEPDKATRAERVREQASDGPHNTADVVPGITGRELYDLIPAGYGDGEDGQPKSVTWRFLLDPRTTHVSRRTLERVAAIPGVELPEWLQQVLDDGLHFSPVATVEDAGMREVYDLSVPSTHAFVGNGMVNHNTVNMPEQATVEDVEEIYTEAWRLGVKALAIYRDNCKVSQPLAIATSDDKKQEVPATTEEAAEQGVRRRRLPKQRPSQTISFTVGEAEGYLTAGEYPGDGLGEIFVKLGKQGSTLSGVMDAFAIATSIGLQYGVPLEEYVKKFTNMRFEPAGMTDDPEVKFAASVLDYIFRRLAIEYLPAETRAELGIYTIEERNAQLDAQYGPAPGSTEAPKADPEGQTVLPVEKESRVDDIYGDAPMCFSCGIRMQRSGACHVCEQCGTTTGCS
ncbi:hypothetical protein ER308_18095 [Egibacter rhizosphaerae]|uniref:Vitamin B12-dependent ribonucleotide reductase n=1 Tax=Egibacter rhizosphaerae TaxID=1670831 RepID=A0A411YJ18_9ACTN|nr:LAGLIDADG family homing endonuclease [Egibacter rhizosphaerae]QBI21294.1 hypothetical protein ER308_18095 [Egibacter rhizosphaerae]